MNSVGRGTFVSTIAISVLTMLTAASCGGQATQTATPPPAPTYQLVWADEFDGSNGSAPDATKWAIQTGGGGWGNNELESYTARPSNAQVSGGNLIITAIKEDYTGTDGIARHYTSARLQTKRLFSQQYGRFEARIQVPKGQGMWPAFWMLGSNIDRVGYPACGELDVMEVIGRKPRTVYGTIHAPGYVDAGIGGSTLVASDLSLAFHTYGVEWTPNRVTWTLDGKAYFPALRSRLKRGQRWAFDHPFYILLNLAVGGSWPGPPNSGTQFPAQMLIDWIRVYQRS